MEKNYQDLLDSLRRACEIVLKSGALSEKMIAEAYRDGAGNITNTAILLDRRFRQKMEDDPELKDAFLTLGMNIIMAGVVRNDGGREWADDIEAIIRGVLGPYADAMLGAYTETPDDPA